MRIFATGDHERIEELKMKFALETTATDLSRFDVVFDLNADENFSYIPQQYAQLENKLLIFCSVKKSIASMLANTESKVMCHLVGLNALPTFIDRNMLEVSFRDEESRTAFSQFASEMKIDFLEVEDSVGMVTPRVICMIINEACLALDEGTASMEDIDKAMKLGTNYPFGPFEWCDRIGIRDVYETLEAIRIYSRDDRYKISSLLRHKYQDRAKFYNS